MYRLSILNSVLSSTEYRMDFGILTVKQNYAKSSYSLVEVKLVSLPEALILFQFFMEGFLCWFDDLLEYVNGTVSSLLASSHHA